MPASTTSHTTRLASTSVEDLLPEVNMIIKSYSQQGTNSGSLYLYPGRKPGKLAVSAKPPPISRCVGKDLYAGSRDGCLAKGKPAKDVQDKAKGLQNTLVAAGYSAKASSSDTCPEESKRWNQFCYVTNSIDGECLNCSAYWSPKSNWRLTKPDQTPNAARQIINPGYQYKYGSENCMPGYVKLEVSWT